MAHPGIWGLAGLSAALIAAGVWLNRPDRAGIPFLTDGPEAAQPAPRAELPPEPLVHDPEPEPEPEPATAAVPEPEPDAAPEPEPETAPEPEPEPEAIQALPPKDELPPPGPTDGASAVPATEPDAAALPAPEPIVEDTEAALPESPVEQPADRAAEAMSAPPATENPVAGPPATYRGGPVWQTDLPEAETEERSQAVAAALAEQPAESPFFGALALAPEGDRFGIVTGYAALAPAEAAALGRCGTDCSIAARLVPEDFDGQRTNTLNAAQAEARAGLSRAALLQATRSSFYYVLAWSDEGAVGTGRIGDQEAAQILALQECRTAQRQITGQPAGAQDCHALVVARPIPAVRP